MTFSSSTTATALRRVAALATIVVLLASATAAAAVRPVGRDTFGAGDLAGALTSPTAPTGPARYATVPGRGTPHGVIDSRIGAFPTAGPTFTVLTTGDAALADDADTAEDSGVDLGGAAVRGDTDRDVSVLEIPFTARGTCLRLDVAFFSEEFDEFVNDQFNDAFIAELDSSTWSTSGSALTAPRNFAFDSAGRPLTINATAPATFTTANAAGTTYDGATPELTASTPVTPGAHRLFLSILDQGDGRFDSAAFVDNLRTDSGACPTGASAFALDLTPDSASSPTGGTHTVTAALTRSGTAVSGARVAFAVEGDNPTSGSATTDAAGRAQFTYRGTNPGTDTITACYDQTGNGSCEASDASVKEWTGGPAGPTVTVDDVRVREGNTGTVPAFFTVRLSRATSTPVQVRVATGDFTARAPGDYRAQTAALTIPAGRTSIGFAVPVVGDTTSEGDEAFVVRLSNPVGATVADSQGTAVIADDDATGTPAASVSDTRVTERDSSTVNLTFTVRLSAASRQGVGVSFRTLDGTATAGSDYRTRTGSLSFAPGTTSLTVAVVVLADNRAEADETLRLVLSEPINARLGDASGTGTIVDED